MFSVDSYKIEGDDTRRIIALIPTVRIPHIYGMLYNQVVPGHTISRRVFVYKDSVVSTRYFKNEKVWLSFGLIDNSACVDLPEDVFESIKLITSG